jgi:hypothetical protein
MAKFDERRADFASIPERYEYKITSHLDGGEERINCHGCGFHSRVPGTPVHVWHRSVQAVHPAVIELCDLCDQQLSGGVARS